MKTTLFTTFFFSLAILFSACQEEEFAGLTKKKAEIQYSETEEPGTCTETACYDFDYLPEVKDPVGLVGYYPKPLPRPGRCIPERERSGFQQVNFGIKPCFIESNGLNLAALLENQAIGVKGFAIESADVYYEGKLVGALASQEFVEEAGITAAGFKAAELEIENGGVLTIVCTYYDLKENPQETKLSVQVIAG
jgi:hypothetical protein